MALIHIVEDNDFLRLNIRTLLRVNGHAAEAFECGEAALPAIARERPDLILCDILMPGITGLEVLREVRRMECCRWTQFVVISASAESERVREAMILGADDFVTKPFKNEELLETVLTRLAKSEADRAALAAEWQRGGRMMVAGLLDEGSRILAERCGTRAPGAAEENGDHGFSPSVALERLGGLVARYRAFCDAEGGFHGDGPGPETDLADLIGGVAADVADRRGQPQRLALDLEEVRTRVCVPDLSVVLDGILSDAFSGSAEHPVRVTCKKSGGHAYMSVRCDMKPNAPRCGGPPLGEDRAGHSACARGVGGAVFRRIAGLHGWEFSILNVGGSVPDPEHPEAPSDTRTATPGERVLTLKVPMI